MIAGLDYGMHICINDSLTRVLKNFQIFKPTGLVLVPLFVYTIYKKIWAEAKKSGRDGKLKLGIGASRAMMAVGIDKRRELFADVIGAFGGRLEKIICGGAALNPKMIEFFENIGVSIYEGFGITECAPLTCVTPYYARKYGSVGPAVPCCQVRISGNMINERGFTEGEIQVKGDNVMLGYYDNPAANEDAFTEDGWFRTGDMGYMDDDQYVFITGRLKSVIVLENGKNVFPEEIEEYLSNIEEIAESVVVGRPAENEKINLVAIVYPDYTKFPENTSEAIVRNHIWALITELNKTLPTYKHIMELEIRNTEFEKTTSKKIKRHLVK
jgi:long-chain acyl-CoA synthetase